MNIWIGKQWDRIAILVFAHILEFDKYRMRRKSKTSWWWGELACLKTMRKQHVKHQSHLQNIVRSLDYERNWSRELASSRNRGFCFCSKTNIFRLCANSPINPNGRTQWDSAYKPKICTFCRKLGPAIPGSVQPKGIKNHQGSGEPSSSYVLWFITVWF